MLRDERRKNVEFFTHFIVHFFTYLFVNISSYYYCYFDINVVSMLLFFLL